MGDHLPGSILESAFKNNPGEPVSDRLLFGVILDAPKLNYPLVNSSDFSAFGFLNRPIQSFTFFMLLLTEVLKKKAVSIKRL